jgi:hypothetical protein
MHYLIGDKQNGNSVTGQNHSCLKVKAVSTVLICWQHIPNMFPAKKITHFVKMRHVLLPYYGKRGNEKASTIRLQQARGVLWFI